MGGPKGAAPTKYHSIRLVDPIYFLWSASKDIYNSSRAKYSKFNLSQSDFAEHLVKFHTETGCSLCCGDAYVSKYRNVGVQTDKEEHKCTCMDQDWREDICETSHPTHGKPLHLDHANFTMYPERLKNHKKPLTEQQLSLQKLRDSRPVDNKNDLGDDDDDDFNDTETLTASEGGSEDETEVFAVNNTDSGSVEGNTRPSLNANCVKYLERQIQKQRDSVEGIISKIKQKIMGGEEEVVTMATKTEKTNLQQSKNGICFQGNMKRAREENDDFITALYSMAAGHDVRYPEVTMATDQVEKKEEEERCDDTSGRLACLEGFCLLPPQQLDCVGMMELASGDELYPKLEEEIEEKQWATEEMDVVQHANDIPKMNTGQEMKSQELPEENIRRLAAESNLDKKAVKPIKITHKKKHYLHHHLDTKLAKLPRLYECKMCFRHFRKSAEMISHYAEEHPDHVANGRPRRDATSSDTGTTSNSFPVLDLNQIAIELRQCKQCKEYVDDIKAHRGIHLVKRFTCETCGKGFFFQSTLRKHRMYHNSQQQSLKLYKCKLCDKAFTDKQSLDENKFSTDNRGEMCLLCKQCSKQFVRQGSLAVHRGTHRMEKPPRCLKCGRGFTQKYNMKRHRRTCIAKSHRNNACRKDFRQIKFGLKQRLKSQEVYLKSANDEPTTCQETVQNV